MKTAIIKDIHNFKRKLELEIQRIKDHKILSKENKKVIFAFRDHCMSKGLSVSKTLQYLLLLRKIIIGARENDKLDKKGKVIEKGAVIFKGLNKDFNKATKEDLKKFVAEINNTRYSEWYKIGYKIILKLIYKFLSGNEKKGVYPDKIDWLSTTPKKNMATLPEDLLNEEDVKKMVTGCTDSMFKAFIFVLYESGCRVGELLTLQIKNVSFDDFGAKIRVEGKTGSRIVRLVNSSPMLNDWMNKHALKNDPNAPLWIFTNQYKPNEQLSYKAVRKKLQVIGKLTEIKKRVNPHSFRHASATYLSKHLSESQLRQVFGWSKDSNMPSMYIHLSGKDTDNAILKASGVKIKEEEIENKLTAKVCPRCNNKNSYEDKYCSKCWLALDIKTAMDDDESNKFAEKVIKKANSIDKSLLKETLKEMIKAGEIQI